MSARLHPKHRQGDSPTVHLDEVRWLREGGETDQRIAERFGITVPWLHMLENGGRKR